jgi:aspartyl-tRNA(Asn)/glutamyl-tRNA(Gln) amidotransferase subunit A
MSASLTDHDTQTELACNLDAAATIERCLSRIDQYEPTVRAWAYLDTDVAKSIAEQLRQLPQGSKQRGPLLGVTIGVKDIVDVARMPTRAASPLTSAAAVGNDAPAIRRLREAGAIILGKTVTTEWACFDPPPTRNPWNFGRTPGGSSSGSAAAVAAGMCVAAVGSQTGGSIIRPGSYCGVYACKPTYGAISLENVIPLSPPLDHLGAFAQSISDLRAVTLTMIGSDLRGSEKTTSHRAPRLGIVEEYFLEIADADVVRVTRDAIQAAGSAGAELRKFKLPASFGEVHAAHRAIMVRGAAMHHREQFTRHPDQYGPCIASVLREGLEVTDATYQSAIAVQKTFQAEMAAVLAEINALLVPATPAAAPSLETTGDLRFNSPWTFAGVPVISLPIATDTDGLPLAIQLVGRAQSDAELFSVASWCETVWPFRQSPPL